MRALMLSAALFALAACGQSTTPPETPAPPEPAAAAPTTRAEATAQDTCGARAYTAMIGTNIAAVQMPAGEHIRVIQPDSVVTQDFRPDRLNIIVDANGAITALECY